MSSQFSETNPAGEREGAGRAVDGSAAPAACAVTLDGLRPGVEARVLAVSGSGPVARRLMEMGVVPGAPIRVVKAAPLGDPLEVRVRSYHLALRRSEAQTISVVAAEA